MTNDTDHGANIRAFIKANGKSDGALDALDALHGLEARATTTAEMIAREGEYAQALHAAQQVARSAVKDSTIKLRGGGGYSVAETEQLIQIARDAFAEYGMSVEPAGEKVVTEGGAVFLRIGYSLRHIRGFVVTTWHDWPITLAGGQQVAQNNRRGTSTSALGYYLRDVLLLERRSDEGEAGMAQQPRSRSGPSGQRPKPPPQNKIGPKADAVLLRIKDGDDEAVEKAAHWLADIREADDHGGLTDYELKVIANLIAERQGA